MDVSKLSSKPVSGKHGEKRSIREIQFDTKLIKILGLDLHLCRSERRKVAKKYKVDWKVYLMMDMEIRRRKALGLNLETGKPNITEKDKKEIIEKAEEINNELLFQQQKAEGIL
ncbi:MAG: hypothetical protein RBR32_06730 [Bacteroidales bacterium]|nr:hypothetical protein [Bacteroidales bacterium]